MACFFGHKLVDGRCLRCGGAMIQGILTPEETTMVIGFLETNQILYRQFALTDAGSEWGYATNAARMFADLKAYFENVEQLYDKATWQEILKRLEGIHHAFPEVLSQALVPAVNKIRDYLMSNRQMYNGA